MCLQLSELQAEDKEKWKIKAQSLKYSKKNIKKVLYRKGLPYLPEIIGTEIISKHQDDLLVGLLLLELNSIGYLKRYFGRGPYIVCKRHEH